MLGDPLDASDEFTPGLEGTQYVGAVGSSTVYVGGGLKIDEVNNQTV